MDSLVEVKRLCNLLVGCPRNAGRTKITKIEQCDSNGDNPLTEHVFDDVDNIRAIGFQIAIDIIGNGYSF